MRAARLGFGLAEANGVHDVVTTRFSTLDEPAVDEAIGSLMPTPFRL